LFPIELSKILPLEARELLGPELWEDVFAARHGMLSAHYATLIAGQLLAAPGGFTVRPKTIPMRLRPFSISPVAIGRVPDTC